MVILVVIQEQARVERSAQLYIGTSHMTGLKKNDFFNSHHAKANLIQEIPISMNIK